MVDMDAFERQVADAARRVVGPTRPIDALAIAREAATRRVVTRPGPVLGALRFLATGAVIALFGGLLVIGFPAAPSDETSVPGVAASAEPSASAAAEPTASASTSPQRSTRTDTLPGVSLVTEEVEPGVIRVVSDGVRDLARPAGIRAYDVYESAIVAGKDGTVWILSADRIFRLGDEAEHAWDGARFIYFMAPSVAPDGTLWWLDGELLRSFDGRRWTSRRVYTDAEGVPGTGHIYGWGVMEAGPDRRVWMTASEPGGYYNGCDGAASFHGATSRTPAADRWSRRGGSLRSAHGHHQQRPDPSHRIGRYPPPVRESPIGWLTPRVMARPGRRSAILASVPRAIQHRPTGLSERLREAGHSRSPRALPSSAGEYV